jgi:hypothetical protein
MPASVAVTVTKGELEGQHVVFGDRTHGDRANGDSLTSLPENQAVPIGE